MSKTKIDNNTGVAANVAAVNDSINKRPNTDATPQAGMRIGDWWLKVADVATVSNDKENGETGFVVAVVASKVGEKMDAERLRFRKLPLSDWAIAAGLGESGLLDKWTRKVHKTEKAAALAVYDFVDAYPKLEVGLRASAFNPKDNADDEKSEKREKLTDTAYLAGIFIRFTTRKRGALTWASAIDTALAALSAACPDGERTAAAEIAAAVRAVEVVRKGRAAAADDDATAAACEVAAMAAADIIG